MRAVLLMEIPTLIAVTRWSYPLEKKHSAYHAMVGLAGHVDGAVSFTCLSAH